MLSSLTIFSGCETTSGVTPKSAVQLPSAPAFMAPVTEPIAVVGGDPKVSFRETRGALRAANGRLTQSRAWYANVRKRYAASKLK